MENKELNLMEYGIMIILVTILVIIIYIVLGGELEDLLVTFK